TRSFNRPSTIAPAGLTSTTIRRSTTPGVPGPGYGRSKQSPTRKEEPTMIVLRHQIGDVLRGVRQRQGRTLREVSSSAQVSLGYLSEVERGQKEASSELLYSISAALDIPLSLVLREVSDRVALIEGIAIPDTVPADLTERDE